MPRRYGLLDLLSLLLVFAVALAARSWYLVRCADRGTTSGPVQVQDDSPVLAGLPRGTELNGRADPTQSDALVHNLREYRWFGCLAPFAGVEEQTAHVAPGHYWLTAWMHLSPVNLEPVEKTTRWIQASLGALTCLLYWMFLRRAIGDLALATIAGLLLSVYPLWVINTAELGDGVLVSFLLALTLYLTGRASREGGPVISLLAGVTLAGLCLVRAACVPFCLAVLVWFLFRARAVRQGWLLATVAWLGYAGGISFWCYRNFTVMHDVIPIADSTYVHLWMGNNPASHGGTQTEAVMLEQLAKVLEQPPLALQEELAGLPQKKRYDRLAQAVWRQVRQDPGATARHRFESLTAYLLGEEWLRAKQFYRARPTDLEALPSWFMEYLPAAVGGSLFFLFLFSWLGWRWSYGFARELAPSSLAVFWLPLPYVLGHAESLHGPRLPLDGVLWCYAVLALTALLFPRRSGLVGR